MKSYKVYILCDESGVRYVGLTCQSLQQRLTRHLNDKSKTHKVAWLNSLIKRRILPDCKLLLDNLTFEEACQCEKFHIAHFRSIGCDLTNATVGGEGSPGCKLSEAHKQAIGNASRGKIASKATRDRMSSAKRGKKFTPDHKLKLSQAQRGKKRVVTEEHRQRMSKAITEWHRKKSLLDEV